MATLYRPKKTAVTQPLTIRLQIERNDYEGNGIGQYQQKIVFASGALAGETVLAKVTEQKPTFLKAKTIKVEQASNQRLTPFCRFYDSCGGCQLQYLSPLNQQQLKQQGIDQMLRHQTGLATLPWQPLLSSDSEQYRRKARIGLWFDKKQRRLHVGFRAQGSKTITAIDDCAVLSPVLAPVFKVLQQVVPTLAQPEKITHAEVLEADGSAYVMVRHLQTLSADEQQRFVDAWPEAIWLGEAQPGQVSYWQTEQKSPAYTLSAQQLTLSFSPDDFIQVNAKLNQLMINQALNWLAVGPDDQVLDLYAGIGNFSLPLAQRAKTVHGVEGLAKMVQQAATNAKNNGLTNAFFHQADLHLPWGQPEWQQLQYQHVLLDPARAGAQGAIPQLAAMKPAQILYVSCNAATFALDAKLLLAAGYQLQKLGALDMFPHTTHLELMALFVRSKPVKR